MRGSLIDSLLKYIKHGLCLYHFVQHFSNNFYISPKTLSVGSNMKKILLFVILGNILLSGYGTLLAIDTPTNVNQTTHLVDHQLIIPISFPEFQSDWIQSLPQGQEIIMNGFDCLNTPGCPSLPVKNLLLGLPPHTTPVSIDIQMSGNITLPGI